jgi:hypothetical protein
MESDLSLSLKGGGESVSQLPLKDKAFLTFLGQNPPFELRRKLAFHLQSFHEIHRGSSSTGPTLQFPSALDSRVGWLLPSEAGPMSRAIPLNLGLLLWLRIISA